MTYSVTASFSDEQRTVEGTSPLDIYIINQSFTGYDYLYYINYNHDVVGFEMDEGDLTADEQTYTGLPIKRNNVQNSTDGEISAVNISVPNTDRVIEAIIQDNNYLRGCEVYIISGFAKYLPSGSGATYIGTTADKNSFIKELLYIDGVSSNEEAVTFICKPKFTVKNVVLPLRRYTRECSWTYLSNECLVPSQNVIKENGIPVNIQDMSIGDKVITDTDISYIKNIFSRYCNEDIVTFRSMYLPYTTKITKNHPIKIIKNKYIECLGKKGGRRSTKCFPLYETSKCKFCNNELPNAEFVNAVDIKNGDYVEVVYDTSVNNIDYINIPQILRKMRIPYLLDNNENVACFRKSINPQLWIKENIEITDDFLRLIGFYLSEGFVTGYTLGFCFNSKEYEYHNDVINIMKSIFNANYKLDVRGNSTVILYSSKLLCNIFWYLCDRSSYRKELCSELMKLSPSRQMNILDGVFRGDGGLKPDKDKIYGVFLNTTSQSLAWQTWTILNRNNIVCSLSHNRKKFRYTHKVLIDGRYGNLLSNRFFNTNTNYSKNRGKFCFYRNNKLYIPVHSVKFVKYEGVVYNLEMEPINMYNVGGIVIHNCDPDGDINSVTYPTCDLSLTECEERSNSTRFGGFPSIPRQGIVVL